MAKTRLCHRPTLLKIASQSFQVVDEFRIYGRNEDGDDTPEKDSAETRSGIARQR